MGMADYIELKTAIEFVKNNTPTIDGMTTLECVERALHNAPNADVVPVGVLEQVRWERDVAMKQLEEHGIPFGGKAPDVVKVVRCKDCKYWEQCKDYEPYCNHWGNMMADTKADYFCSYGERREGE